MRTADGTRSPSTQEWSNVIHARGASPDWVAYCGRFVEGVGVFHKIVTYADGRQMHERHTWDHVTATSARFQQAISSDGETWETNWVMELTRIEA